MWMFLLVVALNLVRDGVILFFDFQTGWAGVKGLVGLSCCCACCVWTRWW